MIDKYYINSQVKKDLLAVHHESRDCCLRTELFTILQTLAPLQNESMFTVKTNSVLCAHRIVFLTRKIFGKKQQIKLQQKINKRTKGKHQIELQINNPEFSQEEISNSGQILKIKNRCCLKASLCGLYWKCGYLSVPKKGLRLDYMLPSTTNKLQVDYAFSQNGVQMFYTQRRQRTVAYTCSSENIEKFLTLIGATATVLLLQDVLITRDIKNIVNRSVNCEVGNLRRSTSSSALDLEAIRFLENQNILEMLSEQLQVVAEARVMFPDLTIRELGEKMSPPLTKAGVFHRLKKLRSAAENERKRQQ
jgi:hypothetical protein